MWKSLAAMLAGAVVVSACDSGKVAPPTAEQRPVELAEFGNVRVDNYFWLNQRDDPDVIALP